ncbi:MAG: class I SAM-dependent methyltransferase [Gemmatimonadaceae bacterium]|nr:class I SAM-dependent methyltransferase [Gemmatimonadaceae bacterium]MCW5825600.1 class I SAM-dependent methyltransferase [Gemmatimonadaceae bacterium]
MATRLLKWRGQFRRSPWMRPYEEDVITELLRRLQPRRCLEWGGGLSTVQFPALLPEAARWLTIEHDAAWARQLATMVTRQGTTVRHVPPDDPAFRDDGDATAFASYLAAAESEAPYDFIFIDGRARAAGVARAAQLLAPEGVVVLHDANRDAYLGATAAFAYQVLLRDRRCGRPRESGGVWLGSLGRDLSSVLDVAFHQRVWAFYNGIGRFIA